MRIAVNGKELDVRAHTLDGLLAELDYVDQRVATALNQIFVRAADRAATQLKEGDEIEIVAPRQGG